MPPQGGAGSTPALGGGGFPALGSASQRPDGRYLVIERIDQGQTLDKVSPFLIDKALRNCCGEVSNVKRIKDGKILVKTLSAEQSIKLQQLSHLIPGINVVITEHKSLNTCRVVITCRELYELDDNEILSELKSEGVIKLDRIKKKINGNLINTSSFILTFATTVRPEKIKIGFLIVPTRVYYPRPIRCFKCMKFGHIGKECQREKICENCAEPFHGDECSRKQKCVNCNLDHRTTSPDCPAWIKENEIIRIKTDMEISHFEAKNIVEREAKSKETYANKISFGTRNCSCKCTCQLTSKSNPNETENLNPKEPEDPKTTHTNPATSAAINPGPSTSTTSITFSEEPTPVADSQSKQITISSPKHKKTKKTNEQHHSSDDQSEQSVTIDVTMSQHNSSIKRRGKPRKIPNKH